MNTKPVFSRILIVLVLLSVTLSSSSVAFAAPSTDKRICECVVYVVQSLFKQGLANPWPTKDDRWDYAYQLKNDKYWSADHLIASGITKTKGLERTLKQTAQAGDVIIFQPNASFYVYEDQVYKRLDAIGYVDSIGYVGHIGFVLSAKWDSFSYYDAPTKTWKSIDGWWITMESANWPEKWGKHETKTVGSVTCDNVSTKQKVFIPNGAKVSFWRVK